MAGWRPRVLGALLAVMWPVYHLSAQTAPAAPAQSAADIQHQRALTDLETRRFPAAVQTLSQIVARDPSNVGAWLDLGISYCLSGNADAASRIFLTLESRDDLPPGVAEVLAFYRTGGCRPPPMGLQGFVSLGGGYASNANLAPLSALISLPGLGVELMLQNESRPRRSALQQAELGLLYALSEDQAWTMGAYTQVQRYRRASELGLDSAQLSLNYRRAGERRVTEGQLTYARLWLGGSPHVGALSVSATTLTRLGGAWSGGLSANVTRLAFNELSSFDSTLMDARARFLWLGNPGRLTLDAGWVEDRPASDRPGGLRRGPLIQARYQTPAGDLGAVDVTVRRGWLRDTQAYSPLLFGDTARASRQLNIVAGWRIPLSQQTTLRLEYRNQSARDSITLFSYDAHTVSAALEWSFSR